MASTAAAMRPCSETMGCPNVSEPDEPEDEPQQPGEEEVPPAASDIAYYYFDDAAGWTISTMSSEGDSAWTGPPGFDPSWSPDGSHIAYQSYGKLINVVDTDGSGSKPITSSYNDYRPRWSPDGKWIAFERLNPDTWRYDVYIVRPDGTDLRNLTNTTEYSEKGPVWSPDSQFIAFVGNKSGVFNVYCTNLSGKACNGSPSGPNKLTSYTAASVEEDLAWNPGTRIAYAYGGELFSRTMLGTEGAQHTSFTSQPAIEPDWSPSGDRLLVRYSYYDVAVITVSSSAVTKLADGTSDDFYMEPKFSPSGKNVVFTHVFNFDESDGEILSSCLGTMSASGSGNKCHTDSTTASLGGRWNPTSSY